MAILIQVGGGNKYDRGWDKFNWDGFVCMAHRRNKKKMKIFWSPDRPYLQVPDLAKFVNYSPDF